MAAWAGRGSTIVSMLLDVVMTSPRTPRVLLDAGVAHALTVSGAYQLRLAQALASNPAVPVADVARVATATTDPVKVAIAATARPEMTTHDVVTILTGATISPLATRLLYDMPDPDGHLAAYLLTQDLPEVVLAHMVIDPRTRLEHATTAALRLAPSPLHIDTLVHYARRLITHAPTPAAEQAARDHVRELAQAVPPLLAAKVTEQLNTPTLGPPQPGQTAWFTHPDTTTAQVIAWATANGPAAWVTALAKRPDHTAELARSAIRTHPENAPVLQAVAQHTLDGDLVQDATLRLRRATRRTYLPQIHLHALTGGDPDKAVTLAAAQPRSLLHVLTRQDLTGEHIGELITIQQRHTAADPTAFWLAVTTHPSTTAQQRRHGADQLARTLTTLAPGPAREPARTIAHLTAHTDTFDQVAAQVADTLTIVDLRALAATYEHTHPLVTAAMLTALPQVLEPDLARLWTGLVDQFPATPTDLATTTAAIAAPDH